MKKDPKIFLEHILERLRRIFLKNSEKNIQKYHGRRLLE